MDIFDYLEQGRHPENRLLGSKIYEHAESLIQDEKISEGQYLELCNGAGVLHQGVMMSAAEASTTLRVIQRMSKRIMDLKTDNTSMRNYAKNINNKNSQLLKLYKQAKDTTMKNAVLVESAIKKKAYARARTMLENHKKHALNVIFEFDE